MICRYVFFMFALISINAHAEWTRQYSKDHFTDRTSLRYFTPETTEGDPLYLVVECSQFRNIDLYMQISRTPSNDNKHGSLPLIGAKIRIDSNEIQEQYWSWSSDSRYFYPQREQNADLLQRMKGAKKFVWKMMIRDPVAVFNIDGFDKIYAEVQRFCK